MTFLHCESIESWRVFFILKFFIGKFGTDICFFWSAVVWTEHKHVLGQVRPAVLWILFWVSQWPHQCIEFCFYAKSIHSLWVFSWFILSQTSLFVVIALLGSTVTLLLNNIVPTIIAVACFMVSLLMIAEMASLWSFIDSVFWVFAKHSYKCSLICRW